MAPTDPVPNVTPAAQTTADRTPARAQAPIGPVPEVRSQVLKPEGVSEVKSPAAVHNGVPRSSLVAPSALQQVPDNRPTPEVVTPVAFVMGGTVSGGNFADPVSKIERKDSSGRNDSVRAKENSTSTGRDAVNTNGASPEKAAASVVKSLPQEPQAPVVDQVADPIVARSELAVRAGHAEFHLQLEPPELGSVRVHLTATDHGISARLFVHEPGARQLIQSQLESLCQRLKEQGITIGRFDVAGNDAGSQNPRRDGSEGGLVNRGQTSKSGKLPPIARTSVLGSRVVDVVV